MTTDDIAIVVFVAGIGVPVFSLGVAVLIAWLRERRER